MIISCRRLLHRHRRSLALLLAVTGLATAVVAAHSALQEDHMATGVAMCLAVVETTLVLAASSLARKAGTPRLCIASLVQQLRPAAVTTPAPRSRAGPCVLQVFRC